MRCTLGVEDKCRKVKCIEVRRRYVGGEREVVGISAERSNVCEVRMRCT